MNVRYKDFKRKRYHRQDKEYQKIGKKMSTEKGSAD